MGEEKNLTAPPVLKRLRNGLLRLEVNGFPVEGVMNITTACDMAGNSYTTVIIHNSAVLFDVEKETQPSN